MQEPVVTQPIEAKTEAASPSDSHVQPSFVAYTHFPAVEQAIEQHLGPRAKLQLPPGWQEGFVRALPWIAVLFLPLQISALMVLIGLSAVATLLGSGAMFGAILAVVGFVLDVIALPGLFKRARKGWTFFTYALAVGALANLIELSIFGLAVSVALIWIAFQVKYRYAV